jgi:hypothetical protein
LSNQCQVLHPNSKKANQYISNVMHVFTTLYVRQTYTSLDDLAQAWLYLILRAAQPIFSQKGGKQRGSRFNTWFESNCQEAWQNYHIMLNSSHLVCTSRIIFKKYCTMIRHKKCSYLECRIRGPISFVEMRPKIFLEELCSRKIIAQIYTPHDGLKTDY